MNTSEITTSLFLGHIHFYRKKSTCKSVFWESWHIFFYWRCFKVFNSQGGSEVAYLLTHGIIWTAFVIQFYSFVTKAIYKHFLLTPTSCPNNTLCLRVRLSQKRANVLAITAPLTMSADSLDEWWEGFPIWKQLSKAMWFPK